MVHEAHCHGVLMGKIGRLSLSYKFLHFDRIAGGMRPCRVRRGGITTVAGPEFQPEAIADGRCGMHDAIVANSPWSNNKGDSGNGDHAAEQPATTDSFNSKEPSEEERKTLRERTD